MGGNTYSPMEEDTQGPVDPADEMRESTGMEKTCAFKIMPRLIDAAELSSDFGERDVLVRKAIGEKQI